jgi:Na+/pantothenate symporter
MNASMVVVMLGLSYALAILVTSCVVAVYFAFRGNYGGLIGLAIDAGICLVCARIYRWRRSKA